MPHSSGGGHGGGGFHGGGFHSGSHSSSSSRVSTVRYSRSYFPGAICYVYYDRRFRPHVWYADRYQNGQKRASWITVIVMAIILLVPLVFILFSGIHKSSPLKMNYDNTIKIVDTADVLTAEQEEALSKTFIEFRELTGITPAFESVSDISYYDLENYAYRSYVLKFNDEKHWLIVYSDISNGSDWAFEGMQGNDTDPILTTYLTDKFNEEVLEGLINKSSDPFTAFNNAFTSFNGYVMKPYYHLETGMIVFAVLWTCIMGYCITSQIMNNIIAINIKDSVTLEEEPELKKCPYCDSPYYAYTIDRCPKCGGEVDFPKKKNINPEYQDPEF